MKQKAVKLIDGKSLKNTTQFLELTFVSGSWKVSSLAVLSGLAGRHTSR